MSLRGIDAQIMITKAADMAPEQSRVVRQAETAQDQFANIIREQTERDLNRLKAAQASAESDAIRTRDGGGGNAYAGSGGKKKKKNRDGEEAGEETRGPAEHIDIKV